jgi:hypothetical protein
MKGDRRWLGNRVFFDGDERLKALSATGDPLERLPQVIDFEVFGMLWKEHCRPRIGPRAAGHPTMR